MKDYLRKKLKLFRILYGSFGLKEYQDQNSTPKFDVINEYIEDLK